VKEARREALKLIGTEGLQDVVEIFKNLSPGTFLCDHCGAVTEQRFLTYVLMYDSNHKTCDACEVKIQEAINHQDETLKAQARERFKDQMVTVIDSLISTSGVPEEFREASMRDMAPGTNEGFTVGQSYFLQGGVGVGKSHMAVALIRQYLESISPEYDGQRREFFIKDTDVIQPIFIEVPELLLRIRDTYNDKNTETEKDIVDHFTETPFLVLDDLGTEKASDFSTLMLYLIINRRSTSGKATIITSNLDLEEIKEKLSERVSSRIRGMCQFIHMTGNDQRR
jgi:DNA replication protein DnaC